MSKKKNNKKANKGNQKVNNQKVNQKNEEVKVNINDKEAENILNKIAKDEVKEEKKVETKKENKKETNKEKKVEAKKENKSEVKEEKKVETKKENKKEAEEKLNEVNKSLQKSKKSNKNSTGWLINKNEDLKISDKIMKISSSMWNLQLMMMHKKYEFELKHKRTKKDVIKVRLRNDKIDLKIKFKEERDITYKTVEIKNENGKETEVKYNKDYLELDDNIIPLDVILMPVFDFYFENKKLKAEYVKYTEGNIKVQNDKITLDLNVRKEGYPIEVKDLSLDSLNELVKEDKDNILGASVEYFRRNIIVEEPEPEDETDGINKFERAFKFLPESKKSILKSVEFSVGNLGNITPIAKIEPVKLKGNIIKSISLGSVERFKMLGLSVGDEVIIKYEINNNKIIPYLDIDDTCEISGERLIEAPTHCPFCGSKLVEDPLLRCNNESCSSRVIGKILNVEDKEEEKINVADKIVAIIEDKDTDIKDKIMNDRFKNKFELVEEAMAKYPECYSLIKNILNDENTNFEELSILQITKENVNRLMNATLSDIEKYQMIFKENAKEIQAVVDNEDNTMAKAAALFNYLKESMYVEKERLEKIFKVNTDEWVDYVFMSKPNDRMLTIVSTYIEKNVA